MERFPFMLPVFCGVPQESVQGIPDFFTMYNITLEKSNVMWKRKCLHIVKTKYIPGFISL